MGILEAFSQGRVKAHGHAGGTTQTILSLVVGQGSGKIRENFTGQGSLFRLQITDSGTQDHSFNYRFAGLGSLFDHRFWGPGSLFRSQIWDPGSLFDHRFAGLGSLFDHRFWGPGSLFDHRFWGQDHSSITDFGTQDHSLITDLGTQDHSFDHKFGTQDHSSITDFGARITLRSQILYQQKQQITLSITDSRPLRSQNPHKKNYLLISRVWLPAVVLTLGATQQPRWPSHLRIRRFWFHRPLRAFAMAARP